ncbi:tetratricopeptide repeat protein [Kribbella sandramycini]|uniref:DNA-binding SARP family transcriptional activator n=1 Tax=Kribbella sandramycini TaxID=60450 RepID=A0A7Y4KX93_9ACTN|nr:BTAD domain-containing putative transcriptional regulator [Kribbella sandramycini]MBB6569824.1 DNA-binding SARP family transcriptional activator [Kribbella sandramycini]NOL40350.1 tetratricopeptide repeat protein [Kribbella sandramycini]
MEFGVLGPLDVRVDGTARTVTKAQARLLAVLLCRPNQWLRADQLADLLWGDADSNPARLQVLVFRLRKSLGESERIEHHDGNYRIVIDAGELDVDRFLDHRRAGVAALGRDELDAAVQRLRAALEVWRGDAFTGLDDSALVAAEVIRLRGEWITAAEALYEAEIRRGTVAGAIDELSELAAAHPLRESLTALLLRGLHQCGRRAEALTRYQEARAHLIEELGLEPGQELRAAQAIILASETEPATVETVRPQQLPPDPADVAGRTAELDQVIGLVEAHGSAAAPLVIAIDGPAGIGKTTFALHVAHRVRQHYQDGQIFLDLRGYSSGEPIDSATALQIVLRALGVPPKRIPAEAGERSAMLRSTLAGQRMLIVLDNARGAEEIRPLIPAADCLLLVTSRNQLRGLAVHDRAHRITLRPLEPEAAGGVLTGAVGRSRAADDPDAVARLAELCGRIPLALRIAGERASRFPGELATLAAELSDEHQRLDHLGDADDPAADLRAAFSWSYRTLAAEDARTFRLLGLHPSGTIGLPAAAVVTAGAPRAVRRSLDRLVAHHLLEEPLPGRFKLHDLLRLYAAELATEEGSSAEVGATTLALLDWYLATAGQAVAVIRPRGSATPIVVAPGPEVVPLQFADPAQALDWFDTEQRVLVDLVQRAYTQGFDQHAWQLAWAMNAYFSIRLHLDDWRTVAMTGRRAAERTGDERALMFGSLIEGVMYVDSSRIEEGRQCYLAALEIALRIGDSSRQASILSNLGLVAAGAGDFRGAVELHEKALAAEAAAPEADNAIFTTALNLSAAHGALGNFPEAIRYGELAVEHFRRYRNAPMEPLALSNIGEAYLCLGEHERALSYCRQAIELFESLDSKQGMANALTVFGRASYAIGDRSAAGEAWRKARQLLHDLGYPGVAELDKLLTKLT